MTSNLLGLRIEDFKNIGLIELVFDEAGGVFSIMGANGAGKSSVLDALESALGGQAGPKFEQPIKEGETSSRIIATLDDLVVTREFWPGGSSVDIRDKEGRKKAAATLKEFYSRATIDPFGFSQLDEKSQADTLLRILGYDPKADDDEDKRLRDERRDKGRERDRLKGSADSFPDAPANAPIVEVSVAELSLQLEAVNEWNAKHGDLTSMIATTTTNITRIEHEIARLQGELTVAQADLGRANAKLEEVGPLKDTAALRLQIQNAEASNQIVRTSALKTKAVGEYLAAEEEYNELSEQIKAVAARKQAALRGKELPAGLTLDPETYIISMPNGSPFSQANTAEKVKIGFYIGLWLNPTLRLMSIRNGNDLDSTTSKLIDDLAKEHRMLVLVETVNESADHGVRIVDGAVAEVRA